MLIVLMFLSECFRVALLNFDLNILLCDNCKCRKKTQIYTISEYRLRESLFRYQFLKTVLYTLSVEVIYTVLAMVTLQHWSNVYSAA